MIRCPRIVSDYRDYRFNNLGEFVRSELTCYSLHKCLIASEQLAGSYEANLLE